MVSDSEPRYRIVDSNGNVVGSLYGDAASGEVRLEESTNENEAVLKSDGTWDVPAVNTEEIPNVYDHIVSDSEELAEALDDAEQNNGVEIKIGDGTFTPFQHKGDSTPFDLSDGTRIEGAHSYQTTNPATDGVNPDGGTIIDAEGNDLFTGRTISGLILQNFHVTNFGRAFDFGDASSRGLNQSVIRNVHMDGGTAAHAIRLYNWHRVRMDEVTCKQGNGLVHAINTSVDNFSPGNSVWTNVLCATQNDIDSGIYFDSTNATTKLNAMQLIRPQVISAGSTTAHGGAGILMEGVNGGEVMRSSFLGVNVEGDFQHHVRIEHGELNYIQFNIAAGSPTWHVYNGTGSKDNYTIGNGNISVYSEVDSNWTMGEFSEIGGNRGRGLAIDSSYDANTLLLRRGLDAYDMELSPSGTTIPAEPTTVDSVEFENSDLSVNSGDSVGQIRKHVGDNRLYEWDGSSWQGVTISNTITP